MFTFCWVLFFSFVIPYHIFFFLFTHSCYSLAFCFIPHECTDPDVFFYS